MRKKRYLKTVAVILLVFALLAQATGVSAFSGSDAPEGAGGADIPSNLELIADPNSTPAEEIPPTAETAPVAETAPAAETALDPASAEGAIETLGDVSSDSRFVDMSKFDGYPTGALPSTGNPTYEAPSSMLRASLASSVDISADKYFPPIGNQAILGSCVAFATTYYQYTYESARLNNWDAKHNPQYVASPKWAYNFINGGYDGGSTQGLAYNILRRGGSVSWSEFPYTYGKELDYRQWYTDLPAMRKALTTRISEERSTAFAPYESNTPITNNKSTYLEGMKTLLSQGHPLVYTTYINSWQYMNSSKGLAAVLMNGYSGAHAMTIVGYDDNVECDMNVNGVIENFERGAFKIANSWGESYGDNGYVWIMYDALNRNSNAQNDPVLNPTSRAPILASYGYYDISVKNYAPKLTVEVTLNSAARNDIVVDLEEWKGSNQPNYTNRAKTILDRVGGPFAFDGTTTASDATFVFDFGTVNSFGSDWASKAWAVEITDAGNDSYTTTVKRVKFLVDGVVVKDDTAIKSLNKNSVRVTYGDPVPDVKVTNVTMNKTSTTLSVGSSDFLVATVSPSNATNKTLSWSSANSNIVKVDQNGKITAVAAGSAYVYAQATDGSGKYAYCYVSVVGTDIKVTSVTLNKSTTTLNVGGTETLVATVSPSNATNKTLSWSSTNSNIVKVDQNGKLTAVAAGSAYIYADATDGSGKWAYCYVTVNPAEVKVTSVTLNKSTTTLNVGGTETLVATVSPSNATNKTLSWSSTNSNIVKVDQNGKLTAVAVGSAYIYADATDGSGKWAYCYVTVNPAEVKVTSVTLNKSTTTLNMGGTETLVATVSPSNATNKTLSWSSSSSTVKVDQYGNITAVAAGSAYVYAQATDGSGKYTYCYVTVNPAEVKVTSVTLNKSTTTLNVGGTETLVATVSPSNATNKTLSWSSSNSSAVKVDQYGKLTAVAAGSAYVYADATDGSGKYTYCYVTVNPPEVKVSSVTLNKTSTTLAAGGTETLYATVSPSNATNKTIYWSSSNSSTVKVDQYGKLTAVAAGNAYVYADATDGSGKYTYCYVTVNPAEVKVSSVTLNKTSTTLAVGGTETLYATVSPSNATNKTIYWSSSNSNVVKVDQYGKLTAVAAGNAYVYADATDGSGKYTYCYITVNPAEVKVSSVTLNKTSTTLAAGGTETLYATVSPSNATNKTIYWSSSNSSTVKVDQYGKLTAVAAGNAYVYADATDGSGKYTYCYVTVNPAEVKVSSVTLNKTSTTLAAGGTETLYATVSPSNATNKTIYWSSSNSNVVKVDQYGKLTAVAAGNAYVYADATDGSGKYTYCYVTVNPAEVKVSSVTLNKSTTTLNVGGTETLVATVSPSNATNKTLSWSSSNSSAVKVDQYGKLTAVAAGSAYVYADATDGSGKYTYCYVTVISSEVKVSSVTLNKTSTTLAAGGTEYLYATVSPSNATNKTIYWSSSNNNVVKVDQYGKLTAVAVGSAYVYADATDGSGKWAYCYVTVTSSEVKVTSVTLNKTSATLKVGGTEYLYATASPSNATNKTLSWSSNNSSIVKVDQYGKLTAVGPGSAYVFADATDGSGKWTYCYVTVTF